VALRIKSKLDVLDCLVGSPCDVGLRPAVRAATVNLERGSEAYQTTVGLPLLADQLLEFYRRRLAMQLDRGVVDLGLPETVEVLSEGEGEVEVIHCTSEFSNIVVFRASDTTHIVGCVVFPQFVRNESRLESRL